MPRCQACPRHSALHSRPLREALPLTPLTSTDNGGTEDPAIAQDLALDSNSALSPEPLTISYAVSVHGFPFKTKIIHHLQRLSQRVESSA